MPIQINPVDFGGLGRLAGGANGISNLPTPGALGLQSLQVSNANRNAIMDRRSQDQAMLLRQGLAQQQLDQQGLLANQQNQLEQQKLAQQNAQFAQNAQLDQAKLAMQQGQFDTSSGLEAQKIAIEKQKADQEAQAKQMLSLVQLNKDELTKRGAFASYGLMAMKNAKTPEEANQIRSAMVQEALSNKFITDVQAKAAATMPISQYMGTLAQSVIGAGLANDYKSMMDANKPAADKSGTHIEFNPDGTIKSLSQDPTAPNKTVAQADLMFAQDNSKELRQLYNKVPDSFFGASALKQPTTAVREWAQKIPVIGNIVGPNEEDKKQLESYSGINGASEMLAMKVIKQLSGVQYSDKQLEFLKAIIPSIGSDTVKSVFEGKAQNLFRLYDQIKQDRTDLLNKGFKIGSPEYTAQMSDRLQGAAANLNAAPVDSGLSAYLKGKGYSDADIEAYMKGKQ